MRTTIRLKRRLGPTSRCAGKLKHAIFRYAKLSETSKMQSLCHDPPFLTVIYTRTPKIPIYLGLYMSKIHHETRSKHLDAPYPFEGLRGQGCLRSYSGYPCVVIPALRPWLLQTSNPNNRLHKILSFHFKLRGSSPLTLESSHTL